DRMRPIFMRFHRSLSGLALLAALLVVPSAWADTALRQVTDVSIGAGENEMGTVLVELTGIPTYNARLDQEAKRLIIDLSGTDVRGAPPALDKPKGVIGGVVTQAFVQDGKKITRVAISMLHEARY